MADNANCCLPFSLFSFLSCVTILQFIGFVSLFTTLCESVPDDRKYCIRAKDAAGNYTVSKEQLTYNTFLGFTIGSFFCEFLALCTLCSRIYCCVKNICVPVCYTCWKCCWQCGNGWYVLLIIGVFLSFVGHIIISVGISPSDLVSYIDGFRFCLGSLLVGIVMVIGWAVYLCVYGCPPNENFLGSNELFSSFEVEKTKSIVRHTTTWSDGMVTYRDEKQNRYKLKRKDYSYPEGSSYM